MLTITPFFTRPLLRYGLSSPQSTRTEPSDALSYLNYSTKGDSFETSNPVVENPIALQRSGNVPQVKKMQLATPFKAIETLQVMGQFIALLHIHEGKYFAITTTDEALVKSIAKVFNIDKSHIKPRSNFTDSNKTRPLHSLLTHKLNCLIATKDNLKIEINGR